MKCEKWIPVSFCAGLSLLAVGCSKKPKPVIEPHAQTIQPMDQQGRLNSNLSDEDNRGRRIIERAAGIFQPIYFAYDQTGLSEDAKRILANITGFTGEYPEVSITIEGYCDERGTDDYNLALGERRAATVLAYLKNSGIRSESLKAISYGEERPAKEGHGEQSWKLNRRVEFKIEI